MKFFLRSVLLLVILLSSVRGYGQLTADFTATPLTGCSPLVVQFTNTSTGNPTSYQWNLGNGVNTVQQHPSTTYTIPGTYTVTLTVSNASGSDTKVLTNYITVLPDPLVGFTANDTNGCPPFAVQFNNTTVPGVAGTTNYNWSFGDGNVSTAQNPAHTYNVPGFYNVTLVATNSGGCVSTLQKTSYIEVYAPPVTSFTATPVSYCGTPATISFSTSTTGSGPYTYSWDFGDGNTGVGATPNHTYVNSGVYTVTVIATDANGCKDTMVKPNYVSVGVINAGFTISPSPACMNAPVHFTNTSVGATTYFWDFGDGNSSNATNPNHTYTASGTYTVKLIAYNSPCADSTTMSVTVNPEPTAGFTFSPNQPCPAPALIQFTNTSSGAISYAWTFGDGGASGAANPSHTYGSNNYFEVSLTATNILGCSQTFKDTVEVHTLDIYLTPLAPEGCAPLSVSFSSMVYAVHPVSAIWYYYPYGVATYSWTFGDGGLSALANPTHTYITPSNVYTANLTITTTNGCTATMSKAVSVGAKPTASFTDYPDTVCVDVAVMFTNTSTAPSTYTSYIWYMGDGNTRSSIDANYAYNMSGYYNVALVANDLGCKDTARVDSAAVVIAPTSLWTEVYNCDTPLLVRFYDTASIDPTSRIWDFGDGITDTASNPVHMYPSLGTYTVTLITFNSNYGCSDTLSKVIELVDPVLDFLTPDTAICVGDSIVFNPTYTAVPGVYWWQINGAAPPWPYSPLQNPNPSAGQWGHRFNQNGIYTISVATHDIHNCPDTVTRNAYVLVAKPSAYFAASPTVGCLPLTVLFTDTSTNTPGAYQVTRNWTFGNGTATVNTDTVSRLYSLPGIFTVTLVTTDNVGCSDTLTMANHIEVRQPQAAFAVDDTTGCIGQTLQFTNSSTGVSLNSFWDFGDGTTSNANAPTKSYNQTGVYTVKLVVTDPTGCKDSVTKLSYISITKPVAAFSMSDTLAICPPLTVTFTNSSTGAQSYTWAFGNSSGSSLTSPTTIYSTSGVYNISLIAIDAQGCTDTATAIADVLGYAGALDYTPLYGCVPLTVEFKSHLLGIPVIIWDFNDGVTVPLNGVDTILHTYITPGAYVPKLILSDNAGCTNSSQGLDTVKVDDVIAGFITSPLCLNTPASFTDTSFTYFKPVTSWYWSFMDGQQTSTTNPATVTFPATGSHNVTLVATNAHGCTDTLHTSVFVYDLPIITAEFDTTICKGDATQMTANGGVSYVWAPGSGLDCFNCQSPSASPVVTTNYIVKGTDARGCVNKDSVLVRVKYVTEFEWGDGGNICEDSLFQLMASGADRYEWAPAESLDDHLIPDPVATPAVTTVYNVLGWEGSCLPDTGYVTVSVHAKPLVDAGKDVTILAGSSTVLLATGENFEYFTWSPAATLSCEVCSNPTASPRERTQYILMATSDKGCKSFDTVTVRLVCDNSQVFIPNTFTPNNDGQNDVFYPRGTGMKSITSLRVYNRWGEVVFERRGFQLNDAASGWDGTYKGGELNSDIFIYSIDGICDNGDPLSWKGDITLIR